MYLVFQKINEKMSTADYEKVILFVCGFITIDSTDDFRISQLFSNGVGPVSGWQRRVYVDCTVDVSEILSPCSGD
jgi:hypothetical protein